MVRLIGVDASAFLKKAIVHIAYRRPTVAIERDAHEEFFGGNAGCLIARQAPLDAGCWMRARGPGKQRSKEPGGSAPRAGIVVIHDSDLIDQGRNGGEVCSWKCVG